MNEQWTEFEITFDEATVFGNAKTGELWFSGATYSFEMDCETFRALYLEMERKGMYDG